MLVSIRKKLIVKVNTILISSFLAILAVIVVLSYLDSQTQLSRVTEFIRSSLVAKAQTLVINNSFALKGMAEDNAFTAVQELVSTTVQRDLDITYGIFMDIDNVAWVSAAANGDEVDVTSGEELTDENSLWVSELEEFDYRDVEYNGGRVIEFASPVIVDDEILGFIRYGVSTEALVIALSEENNRSTQLLIRTLAILLAFNAIAVLVGAYLVRKMAWGITKPIGLLNSEAEVIASGNYDSKVEVDSNDEIGQLAVNFETMRVVVKKKIEDLAKINLAGENLAKITVQQKAFEEVLLALKSQCGASLVEVILNKDGVWSLAYDNTGQDSISDISKQLTIKGEYGRQIHFFEDVKTELGVSSADSTAALIVPLKDNAKLLGFIVLSGSDGNLHFNESDMEFCQSLARLLVITLNKITMMEVIEEQNRTLEAKVEERTAELQEKTNDILSMMQNMHQGLFTIMPNENIHHEYAAHCETIFGTKDIAGRNFMDLLFKEATLGSNELDQISTAANALLGEDEMMWDFNSHLLTTEYERVRSDKTSQYIELDWDPIILEGVIDKIMVTVRDVTNLRALQAEAEQQKIELEIIGHILSISEKDFESFINTSFEFIEKCEWLIKDNKSRDLDVVASLFRNMHTVKGNARTYGFTHITDSVHEVETTYDSIRKDESVPWDQEQLLSELEQARNDILRYQRISEEQLGRGKSGSNSGGIIIDENALQGVVNAFEKLKSMQMPDDVIKALTASYKLLESVNGRSLDDVLENVKKSANSISKELGKPSPDIAVNDGGVLFTTKSEDTLVNVFNHLIRNSLDHGLEKPEIRESLGKPPVGNIAIEARTSGSDVSLVIYDDGKGLPINKLRSKVSESKGQKIADALSVHEIANTIFESGTSTASEVTNVSGRGVGMEAVKAFIKGVGGDIKINLHEQKPAEEGFCMFEVEVVLPRNFYHEAPEWIKKSA